MWGGKAGIIHRHLQTPLCSEWWSGTARFENLCWDFFFFSFALLNIVLEEFVSEFLPGIAPRLQAALPSPSVLLGDRDTQRFAFYHTQNQVSIGLRPHFSASIVKLWGIQ